MVKHMVESWSNMLESWFIVVNHRVKPWSNNMWKHILDHMINHGYPHGRPWSTHRQPHGQTSSYEKRWGSCPLIFIAVFEDSASISFWHRSLVLPFFWKEAKLTMNLWRQTRLCAFLRRTECFLPTHSRWGSIAICQSPILIFPSSLRDWLYSKNRSFIVSLAPCSGRREGPYYYGNYNMVQEPYGKHQIY